MSFKSLFDKASQVNSLANKSAADIGDEVESPQYHEQDIINESRFIPNVDYSKPRNFARYGSAKEYYAQSVERIYDTFPYDGSLKERLEWENDSTYLDLHIYDNLYPRTNGYVIISSGSWGTTTMPDAYGGYGLPSSVEFISFLGGPHPNPDGMSPVAGQFTGSNYYNASNNRENNLKYDLQNKGVTVEFWLKKDNFITSLTEKEIVFDLWNGQQYGTDDYGRLTVEITGTAHGSDPIRITALSGTTGVIRASVASSTFTTASVADGNWHHYAISLMSASTGIETRFYFDGNLNNSNTTGSVGINEVTAGGLRAYIGAAISEPAGTSAPASSGKLSGSLDEFRYWKTRRSSKDIGRYWFDQIGGGTNSDPKPFTDTQETVNTNLGVYFKFNEGITGVTATDSTVLDYSGRISNGAWTGYSAGSRQTGSAIVLSDAATKEFKDPIIYSFHPDVEALQSTLAITGSEHDALNNSSIYNSIPAWITEEDAAAQYNTKYLTQIMGSYFDTLHMQMHEMNSLKDIRYVSGSNKALPFSNRLLSSNGFVAPDIFIDADVLEKLADRSEDLLYEKSLTEVKNVIYQNVYNNLSYIYKSKGTEKAFRNLIRCFGIDDELIKLSLYADNTEYEYRENRRIVLVSDRVVNFNTPVNKNAVVFSLSSSASPSGSTGFVPSSTALSAGFAYTLESDIIFPKKPDETSVTYFNTNAISSSLFGVHGAPTDETETSWPSDDSVNFQVYTVRDELTSPNVKFVLTGTSGGHFPPLETSLYEEVYNNTRWNLSVRVKPQNYPLAYFADEAANGSYTVVFSGVGVRAGEVVESFEISGTASPPDDAFVTGSRRMFVGAHRTNFTGAVLQTSDVEVDACRFWLDYVDNVALNQHALDSENYGALQPSEYAYPFDTTASYGDIKKADTLAFNWEFSQNTGSNAAGQFLVADESSGSAEIASSRFGDLGPILGPQYTGLGYDFGVSSTDPIKKEFIAVSRLNDLETIAPSEMVDVLGNQDQILFKIDSRPVDYYFAFEKSMAKVISEEMVNMFGTLKDFNNMIGQPVNRFRQEYKALDFMRQAFFEKVGNSQIDFDHFYEFYKWFDSSLSYMLGQLVPASADFAENIRTVIENTSLERNKYRSQFPFVDAENLVFETAISSNVDYGNAISSPDDDPQGTGFYPIHAPTRRQVGRSERADIKKWKYVHAPVTENQQENYLWWKNKSPRNVAALAVDSVVDDARGTILNTIRQDVQRESGRPYRFGFDGTKALGGVGTKQNKDVNFMFAATSPFGPLVKQTNIPENIMLSYDTDVEQLVNTTDEFYPTYKQRLGFGINPKINVNPDIVDKRDGNSVTTFSLYHRSTPLSTYEEDISSSYKSGVTITNLHHDYVDSTDIPLQGPFTEKFVGGRQFRHTEINAGSDTRTTRFEGYRIELGVTGSTSYSGSLGIVPGNYPFADTPPGGAPNGFLSSLAIRSRFRDETAKRPVNIKNILMTTEPLGTRLSGTILHNRIGNYSKNYQVVQTSGRTYNDPFFNDQSFDFAESPQTETPALPWSLNRHPVQNVRVANTKAIAIGDGANKNHYTGSVSSALNTKMRANSSETWLAWVYLPAVASSEILWWTSGSASGQEASAGRFYFDGTFNYRAGRDTTDGSWTTAGPVITAGEWTHIAVSYDGTSVANDPVIYANGVSVDIVENTTPAGTLISYEGMFPVGYDALTGFDGNVSGMAFYNTALKSEEIAAIYGNATLDLISYGPPRVKGNLLMWWRMGNGTKTDGSARDSALSIFDQVGNLNLSSVNNPTLVSIAPSSCLVTANDNNFALPDRTGANSNKTVFVTRFSSPGEYKTISRGYLDPAHEELSVYNALPYRNRGVINYGLSGSASAEPDAALTVTVVDQIDKNRGLDQRATLHCGPFGIDAAYGSITAGSTRVDGGLGYSVTPSWHKTNRNALTRVEQVQSNAGHFDGDATLVDIGTDSVWNNLIGGAGGFALPFTLSAWVYIKGDGEGGDGATIIAISDGDRRVHWNPSGTEAIQFNIFGSSSSWVLRSSALSENEWYHVVATYTGGALGTGTLYINGVKDHGGSDIQGSTPYSVSGKKSTIGNLEAGTDTFDGYIRECGIWTRALSADEAKGLYNAGIVAPLSVTKKSLYGVTTLTDELIAYYRLNPVAGDTTSKVTNRSPVVPAGTDGTATALTYVRGVGPTTVDQLSVYDNLFVQHQIPRSEQQYSWIGSALRYGETIYGLDAPACLTSSVLDKLIVSGTYVDSTFVGLTTTLTDPLTASTHTLGYSLATDASASYDNSDYWSPPAFDNGADYFNSLMTSRHGPYQWPTWKQIRTGETKVARTLRNSNTIGVLVPPPMIRKTIGSRTIQYVRGKKSNEFIDYTEQPISSRHYPVTICLEDNTEDSNTDNNILMNVTYGNLLDYFSHQDLNNRLGIPDPNLYNNALNSIFEYVTSSAMSVVIGYSERIYPRETNVYRNIVRRRTQFTIDDIWNSDRDKRSVNGGGATGIANSQGVTVNSSSTWPMDGHLNFTTVASTVPTGSDGAGELLNSYSRYGLNNTTAVRPGATYAWRIPVGSASANSWSAVLAGDAKWEAATQSGKNPYENYEDYSEKIARIGKDHSIVPEFRISPLIESYVETSNGDFLADVSNILELTGASIPNSSEDSFFTTYTNADFLKYFSVVDEEINDKRSGDLKIRRDKVSLKCSALLKFLPYKGFYPAERTHELATLFSQSYADTAVINIGSSGMKRQQVYRALLEPFFSPGIMFNTIKSGIGVSTCVLANTESVAKDVLASTAPVTLSGTPTTHFEGTIQLKTLLWPAATEANLGSTNGYYLQRLPFETLYKPRIYLSKDYITGSGAIYDNGVIDTSVGAQDKFDSGGSGPNYVLLNGGKKLYEMAIDNFLCETTNFFLDRPAMFESKREDQFESVVSGSTYTMQLKMFRTLDEEALVATGSFNLYSRESAFGFAIAGGQARSNSMYGHLTPPYYSGSATTTFTYTAQASGIPTLSEIFANTVITHTRDLSVNEDVRPDANYMYNDSCFNLTDYYSEVPKGTTQQSSRWLIQSKFETPVLNFANVDYTKPAAGLVTGGLTPPEDISIRGMWHQYGHLPTGSQEGIFALVEKGTPSDLAGGSTTSLADIVGMQSGIPLRIGNVKSENVLEEAVVVVPFKTVKNRRKFFEFSKSGLQSDTYSNLKVLMDKYIFPPKFDFTRHASVAPIQMYAFEFAASTTQQDIADMWQNLPPSIADTFEHKEVTIEENELINALIEDSTEIQWMVFKVKKRARKNYEKYRRSLATSDTSGFPDTIGEYSYNWPYDYFSLVELVKIDESVQYISSDLTEAPDSKVQIVGDVNVNVANPIPVINMPEGSDR